MFVNCNGMASYAGSFKDALIRERIVDSEVDMMGLAEVNICWTMTHSEDRLYTRTRGWFPCRQVSTSHLHEKVRVFQPGGVAQISNGTLASRACASGGDKHGLGRWTWTQFRCKKGRVVTMATVYRPTSQNKPAPSPRTHSRSVNSFLTMTRGIRGMQYLKILHLK